MEPECYATLIIMLPLFQDFCLVVWKMDATIGLVTDFALTHSPQKIDFKMYTLFNSIEAFLKRFWGIIMN